MENKISERNVVLGLTIVSIGLLAGMMIMPSMVAPQSDIGHVYGMYEYADSIANGSTFNPWIATGSVLGSLAALAISAFATGGISAAAALLYL